MLRTEERGSPLANYDARSHHVARCYSRHDRPIGNPKVIDSVYFEIAIHHRHGVPTHLGGAGLVPVGRGFISPQERRRNFSTQDFERQGFASYPAKNQFK